MPPEDATVEGMSFSAHERAQLAELFLELGPDAPTLCEGWTTKDLAVHLYVRENRPDAAAGMFLPPAKTHLERVSAQVADKGYEEVVRLWARGPARFNPLRFADTYINAAEHFVHHEDVRRAQQTWQPRALGHQDRQALYRVAQVMSRVLLAQSNTPVVLVPEGFGRIVVGERRGVADPAQAVQVLGSVGELVLWAYGRPAVGVRVEGDESAVVRREL